MAIFGIDISNNNEDPGKRHVDLAQVKAGGASFVIAKVSEGLTFKDAFFPGHRAKAAELGLPFGTYHFANPGADRSGADEAKVFLSIVKEVRDGELPCALDLERTRLGRKATTAWALDWLTTVHQKTGQRPIVYTSTNFAETQMSPDPELAAYPLWLANFRTHLDPPPPAPAPWSEWTIWQHSEDATVHGVLGACDRNITNHTVAELLALGSSTATATMEFDAMATKEEIALGVWRSDIIPSPDKLPENPTWQADSYLRETYRLLRDTQETVIELRAALAALSAKVGALDAKVAALQ